MATAVLGISGSPRKDGNTDVTVKMVLEELGKGGLATEFLRIADYRIKRCEGCRKCMSAGECAIKDDDFARVLGRVECSHLVIIGSPVYWNGPPGVLKDFIDRTHGFYLDRGHFAGKKFGILSVAADSGFENQEAILESWIRSYGGEIVGKVRVLAREKGEVLSRPSELGKLNDFSACLLRSIQRGKR
ncbi:MAG: flavodoxin family protein [Candidatus Brockarchaeota archaeon]|nr:flavodoxin family protein [Candidatus Brockarchaeota archaeon]